MPMQKEKKKEEEKEEEEDKEAEWFQISHFYWLFLKWHHGIQGPVKQPLSLSLTPVYEVFFRTYKIWQLPGQGGWHIERGQR